MARIISGHVIRGTIDGITFYYNKGDGRLCRMQAGISAKQFRKGRQFERVRRENRELSVHSSDGRLFREALQHFLQFIPAHYRGRRIDKVINSIKKLNQRIEDRHWLRGLQTAEGKSVLSTLNLGRANLRGDILRCAVEIHSDSVVLSGLEKGDGIALPQAATHVLLTAVCFKAGESMASSELCFSEGVLYSPVNTSPEVVLKFDSAAKGHFFLSAVFFAENEEGEFLLLKDRSWNGFGGV